MSPAPWAARFPLSSATAERSSALPATPASARTECTHPERSLTTTVKVSGGVHPVVPVKSAKAVPKDKVKDCVKEIAKLEIKAPVKIGDVVCANILGTGVDIVATNICPEA